MKLKSLLASACFFGGILTSGTAMAHGNCASVGHVSSEHNSTRDTIATEHGTTRDAIIAAIDVMKVELIQTLTLHVRENSNQSERGVEAARRISDAEMQNATDRMRQQFRAEAESGRFDPNPFLCLASQMFNTGGTGVSGAPTTATEVLLPVVDHLSGNSPEVRQGGTALLKSIVDARDELAGFRNSPNATTDWGLILREPTLDYTDPRAAAVYARIAINGVNPTPPLPPTPEEIASPQGAARVAAYEKAMSRHDATLEVVEMTMNMRHPVITDDVLSERGVSTWKGMAFEDSNYNRLVPDVISELSALDINTTYHYSPKGERLQKLQEMNETAWLAELHRIMAIDARINYLRLEMENRHAIVSSLILATLNDK